MKVGKLFKILAQIPEDWDIEIADGFPCTVDFSCSHDPECEGTAFLVPRHKLVVLEPKYKVPPDLP